MSGHKSEVFSIRIVIADFYMEKPINTLGDPCYSEFRGKSISRVPVLRIFGSTLEGQKACMHVHGVFPYFYIPYKSEDFESLNKAIFQIALNIDKAINISLGQGNSTAQHVFKVQLVKGIPFYGYHRSEHQFLKIFMYNPRFIRRAANLLQNGAVMGKIFYPHESHVPYVLQFMIDYNLYGMSSLHVPLEIVKFRVLAEHKSLSYRALNPAQVIDAEVVTKVSVCKIEVDISSHFILNRFQLVTKDNVKHSNPGIEAIWHDEEVRRQKLSLMWANDVEKLNTIPPLEVPVTQERPNVHPTDSETFYRMGLLTKLAAIETSMSTSGSSGGQQTLNNTTLTFSENTINVSSTNDKVKKRTFNLQQFLTNAVYPEECKENEDLVNASCIQNHFSDHSMFHIQEPTANELPEQSEIADETLVDESVCLDNTIVDEDLVLNLTQRSQKLQNTQVSFNASLREEDIELLDVLQELEEKDENAIDLDSSLAPLTQTDKNFELTPDLLDKELIASVKNKARNHNSQGFESDDSSDENENNEDTDLHDFSIVMDDIDEWISKISQKSTKQGSEEIANKNAQSPAINSELNIPQVDGADDIMRTPTKRTGKASPRRSVSHQSPKTPKNHKSSTLSPTRSPRTPKMNASAKYAPLPLFVTNRSANKNTSSLTRSKDNTEESSLMSQKNISSTLKNSLMSLQKQLEQTEKRRRTIDVPLQDQTSSSSNTHTRIIVSSTKRRTRHSNVDLDKTHITCALTPRRKSERLLKVYKVESADEVNPSVGETEQTPASVKRIEGLDSDDVSASVKETKVQQQSAVVMPRRSRRQNKNLIDNSSKSKEAEPTVSSSENIPKKPEKHAKKQQKQQTSEEVNTKILATNNCEHIVTSVSSMEPIVLQYNTNTATQHTTPLPETCYRSSFTKSLDESPLVESPFCDWPDEIIAPSETEEDNSFVSETSKTPNPKRLLRSLRRTSKQHRIAIKSLNSHSTSGKSVSKLKVDTHLSVHSPSIFSELSSPGLSVKSPSSQEQRTLSIESTETRVAEAQRGISKINANTSNHMILTPMDLPPTCDEVLKACEKLSIYEYEFQKPFYSNPDDVTKGKEVGFTVLHIPSNKLNDCEEFQSNSNEVAVASLNDWRRRKLTHIAGPDISRRLHSNQSLREYCATRQKLTIEPQLRAPTRHDAKLWLKAWDLLQKQSGKRDSQSLGNNNTNMEDSPIKVRRQKVTMMFHDETNGSAGSDEDLDYSSCNLTLTPFTPNDTKTNTITKSKSPPRSSDATPLSTLIRNDKKCSLLNSTDRRKGSGRPKRARLSLNAKLKAVAGNEKLDFNKITPTSRDPMSEYQHSGELVTSQTSMNSNSDSTSISSQTAAEAMERSSFLKRLHSLSKEKLELSFGLKGNTLNNTFGFKVNLENLQEAKANIEYNYTTTMVIEVFVPTRGDLHPNPEFDPIRCMFYAIDNCVPNADENIVEGAEEKMRGNDGLPAKACGYILVIDPEDINQKEGKIHGIDADIEVRVVKTEIEALESLLALCKKWDPDIFAGYEIEMASWGYIIDRAKYLCLNIAPLLSRVPKQKMRDFVDEDRDHFTDLDFEMKLCGRIMLDVWRLMRSEIALTSYTFENVMYHILHKRCPSHSYRHLTSWFDSPCSRWIVLEFYLERVQSILALLDQLDLIGRTSEMAKLIGIQFYEVLSRGSQFRVESMMLRIAKPRNLVPLSPSVQQRAHMRAPEYLPLILEPQSRFYPDPVIVLDFQSLYPSMIIGYNYCFSTCLGRVEHLGQTSPFEFGASQLRVSPTMLQKLIDDDLITISPCGVVFVKSSVREGILPRMLTEILDTRQMVKQSMKLHKSNSALQRILHSRQLGLKLMANVTYGYTAANFSGRMPAVEVGDSVVAKGRETLERAIKLVESNEKWGVKVVYGDTDSMFVLVPGRNREQAFKIGEEISAAVTKDNPHPVKLKLEKVYQPCILQTKKRYVGYMYETPDQKEPIYEAKGIETVRRDGCPAVAKMLEKVLRILFETADVSQVKQYVCRQFTKILSGNANLQDLIFAKEFRGLNGYKPTACVPALEMTRKWIRHDPRRIPRHGERVPFIITNGPPGVPLIRLVRHPHEVLSDDGLKINAMYYITKAIIPPLNRCLLLIGADVNDWFANLPRKILLTPALSVGNQIIAMQDPKSRRQQHQHFLKKSTISQYFSTTNCVIDCGRQTKEGICEICSQDPMKSVVTLHSKIGALERGYYLTQQICQTCCGRVGDINCNSLDCPVLYVLEVKHRNLSQITHFRKLLQEKF